MSITWSPRQKEAIEALNTNVLVSASAGAGKTAVLIGRLMKRVEIDRINLDEVVAITFTELAASEMRKRLAKNLSERIKEIADGELKDHLNHQLALLPSAYITTIHAFCLKIIENYSYVAQINPEQAKNVLDEPSKKRLWNQAFNEAYREMVIKSSDKMQELVWHFDSDLSSNEALISAINLLKNKLNTLEDPQEWIEMSLKNTEIKSYAEMKGDLKFYLDLHFNWQLSNLMFKHRQLIKALDDPEYLTMIDQQDDPESLYARIAEYKVAEDRSHYFEKFEALKTNFDYSLFRDLITQMRIEQPNTAPPLVSKSKKFMAKKRDSFKNALDKLIEQSFEENAWFGDGSLLRSRLETLYELTSLSMRKYEDLKKKENVIDFDDMEHLAIKILKNTDFNVNLSFKAKIKEIMVDEFQDTNEIQNQIVELISNGSNIFRVGDVKQSIYRFRNAQPQLMMKLMQKHDDKHLVLFLDENYRSKESIVNFNNHIFDQLMTWPSLNATFQKEDWVKIGRKLEQAGGDSIELHQLVKIENTEEVTDQVEEESFVDDDDEDKKTIVDLKDLSSDQSQDFIIDENAKLHALHIRKLIKEMQKEGIYTKNSDYVVLVRANAEKEYLQDIFEKANIPSHISAKTGFFNAPAVQDVLLMMRTILNPYDDLNFIGLAQSHFLELSDVDLAQMALIRNKRFYIQVYKEMFMDKHNELMDFIYQIRSKDLLTILKAIFRYNHYYDDFCDKQARANLDLLFEKAIDYRDQALSLSEFVTQITSIEDHDSIEAIPFTEEDDVVRVMTIHQSKGLEFPVVLYWSRLSAKVADNNAPLIADSELGFMLKTIQFPHLGTRRNPVRIAIEMKTRLDDLFEQIRLIYVALTRAVDKLIIIDKKMDASIPLEVSVLLNAVGSTRLIDAAMNNVGNKVFAEKLDKDVDTKVEINQKIEKMREVFEYTVKPSSSIEFKTPSSSHPKMTEVHLNFNQNKGTVHGTEIHKLFEDLPHKDWTKSLLLEYKADLSESDQDAFMAYYHSDIYQDMLKGEIKHEYAFHALLDHVVIHGYMDCIAVCDDVVYCIDYKTDGIDEESQFIELYHEQIENYMDVLQRQYPDKKVVGYLYSLRLKKFIEIKGI